jgi:hypothetical protein
MSTTPTTPTTPLSPRDHIFNRFSIADNGTIACPGNFEGEMLYVPYFWDASVASVDGYYHGNLLWPDDSETYLISITSIDRGLFPEIPADCFSIHLSESSNGSVTAKTLTEAQHTLLQNHNDIAWLDYERKHSNGDWESYRPEGESYRPEGESYRPEGES